MENDVIDLVDDVTIRQFLSFNLSADLYAVEVRDVREVIGVIDITRVPRMPEFMLGVINLRGSVVPVIDLRLKFGMVKGEVTVDSCIIIMESRNDDEMTLVGALVDSVREVIDLRAEQIEPTPRMGKVSKAEYIQGVGKADEGFLILLEINKIFRADEIDPSWHEKSSASGQSPRTQMIGSEK